MNTLKLLCLSTMLVTLIGCPYRTEHSLGTPGADKVDAALIGHWKSVEKSALVSELTIDTADAYELVVEILESGSEFEEQTTKFFGFTTKFADHNWVYFWPDRADGPQGYYYFTYHFDDEGKLVTRELTESKAKAANPETRADFKKYIEENMEEGEILSPELKWALKPVEEKEESQKKAEQK